MEIVTNETLLVLKQVQEEPPDDLVAFARTKNDFMEDFVDYIKK